MYHTDVHIIIGHLGYRLDNSGRALEVSALAWADSVRQRQPCMASVCRRTGHLAEWGIIGNGQSTMAQDRVKSLVLSVLMLGKVDQICRNIICVIVIISVLRSVQSVGADLLISIKVCF